MNADTKQMRCTTLISYKPGRVQVTICMATLSKSQEHFVEHQVLNQPATRKAGIEVP
jgi:hypothetical protein